MLNVRVFLAISCAVGLVSALLRDGQCTYDHGLPMPQAPAGGQHSLDPAQHGACPSDPRSSDVGSARSSANCRNSRPRYHRSYSLVLLMLTITLRRDFEVCIDLSHEHLPKYARHSQPHGRSTSLIVGDASQGQRDSGKRTIALAAIFDLHLLVNALCYYP